MQVIDSTLGPNERQVYILKVDPHEKTILFLQKGSELSEIERKWDEVIIVKSFCEHQKYCTESFLTNNEYNGECAHFTVPLLTFLCSAHAAMQGVCLRWTRHSFALPCEMFV